MATFVARLIGAARLNAAIYEEVEADTTALRQAMLVVVLSSVAAGVGHGGADLLPLLRATVSALLSWFVWALIVFLVGTKVLPTPETRSDVGELLRTTGFAAAPGMLRVFGVSGALGPIVRLLIDVWLLAAMVVAVRQALDYTSTWRAIGVCLSGWWVLVLVSVFTMLV